jgi:AcrR family transcriptional regulator
VSPPATVDRAARVRRALVELVAELGFRGATMAAVAARAGVAAGTAYVHYESKDDLILAAYREVKRDMGRAGAAAVAGADPPEQRFRSLWRGIYAHLAADPVRAGFLLQFDASPYAGRGHAAATADPDDDLMPVAAAPDMATLLADLPPAVVYDLGLGPAVRLAASGQALETGALDRVVSACWRAITAR